MSSSKTSDIDPTNLSNYYFISDKEVSPSDFYVHPSIVICNDKKRVVHGRGMIVDQEIQAGDCLFVSPPTVTVDLNELKSRFLKEGNDDLEEIAISLLEDNMLRAIQNQQQTTINSFLALMGMPSSSTKPKFLTIDLLNGKDDREVWSNEELSTVKKSDLRNIILKNAFGPDFITYEKIQRQWRTPNSSYFPPHILGIYPLAAMLNHSCSVNAVRSFSNGIMIVHASKTIPVDTEVVWSYIPPTQVFADRRRALKSRHRFMCKCERCIVEAKQLRNDILPLNLKAALEEGRKWNEGLMDISSSDDVSKRHLCTAFVNLEESVFGSTILSNEAKRHLRVGYTNFHFNYFNTMLSAIGGTGDNALQVQELVLGAATQLHFAFCSSNNASTEHLSVLHLCYELANAVHHTCDDKTMNKVIFFTEALKKAHMIRYGVMKSDLEVIRNCLMHTRAILRLQDGYLRVKSNFL